MSEPSSLSANLRDAQLRFAALVDPLRPALHRYCSRMIGSALDGEDMVQETLARACFRFPTLPPDVPLRPWLFTIAHHRCVDFLRARSAAHTVDIDDQDLPAPEDDVVYEDRDFASQMFSQLVLALPPRERAAVTLKEVLGFSLAEIATILDTSLGGVKAALHRGRTKLLAARDIEPVPAGSPAPGAARYIDAFNRRDWSALLALLEDDVRLDVVGHIRRRGRKTVGDNYIRSYSAFPHAWRLVLAEVDGEPVLVCLREHDGVWSPRHAVRIEWNGERVVGLRDYAHVPYLLDHARVVL